MNSPFVFKIIRDFWYCSPTKRYIFIALFDESLFSIPNQKAAQIIKP